MSEQERPYIDVRPQTVFCPAHGEHFRAQWPKGAPYAFVTMIKAALESESFARVVDPDAAYGERHLDERRVNEILRERPACYWVDRGTIRRVLMGSEIGTFVVCRMCGRSGLGGPYDVALPTGRETRDVCFECALDNGEGLHRRHPNGKVWPTE